MNNTQARKACLRINIPSKNANWEYVWIMDPVDNILANHEIIHSQLVRFFFKTQAPLKYGGIYVDMDHVSSRDSTWCYVKW